MVAMATGPSRSTWITSWSTWATCSASLDAGGDKTSYRKRPWSRRAPVRVMIGRVGETTPTALPELPDHVDADGLRDFGDAALESAAAELQGVERGTLGALAPYE